MKHAIPVPEAKKMHFANWLKTTRKAKRIGLTALAKAAGISTTSVAHHCQGINFPHETHPHILPAYERLLGERWVYPPVAHATPVQPPIDKTALAALLTAVATGQFEIVIRARTNV